jgi:hypothetical protein
MKAKLSSLAQAKPKLIILIVIAGLAASQTFGQNEGDKAASAAGDASFNAADRLAIVNLFGACAQSYDAGNIDQFLSLFTDTADIEYVYKNETYFNGLAEVTRAFRERTKAFESGFVQRRHALNTYVFTSQTDNEASGRVYFQVFSTFGGGMPIVAYTGYYEFTAVKQGSTWKFSGWFARADSPLR